MVDLNEHQVSAPEANPSDEPAGEPQIPGTPTPVAPSGRRQAFLEVRRHLTDDDLTSPGVQKLILDELEQSEAECERLRAYIDRFYDADKRAAILQERLKPARAIEIFFGVGLGLGGAIVGLAPFFWRSPLQGILCLLIGVALIFGAVLGRSVKG